MLIFGKSKMQRFLIVQGAGYKKIELTDDGVYLFGLNPEGHVKVGESEIVNPLATLYQETGDWVLTLMNQELSIIANDRPLTSISLEPEVPVYLGDVEIKVVEMVGQKPDSTARKSSSLTRTIVLSAILGIVVILIFVGANKSETRVPAQDVDLIGVEEALFANELENSSDDKPIVVNDSHKGFVEYKLALSYYDAGNLVVALRYLEESLQKNPENSLSLKKLVEIETTLDRRITLHYQNGCEHAAYMRNYEARADFRAITSLVRNNQDDRYIDALSMLEALETKNKRILCKEKS